MVDASAILDVDALAAFYPSIPVDPYIPEGYRYKAIAWLRVKHRLGAVNEHIARANELSGMRPDRSRALLSDAPPSWTSDETGYLFWKLKMDADGKMSDEMVLDAVVPPGYLIYWNDRRVWHYGTDLEIADPAANGGHGFRNIVILSAKEPPAHVPMASIPARFLE